jgi:hypothetical protein
MMFAFWRSTATPRSFFGTMTQAIAYRPHFEARKVLINREVHRCEDPASRTQHSRHSLHNVRVGATLCVELGEGSRVDAPFF